MEAPYEIIRVTDTRDIIEDGDRWVRIHGSGDTVDCDRCGRSIEIHAEILDANGDGFVVGTGCMGADVDKAIRSAVGKAQRADVKAARAAAAAVATAWLAGLREQAAAVDLGTDADVVVEAAGERRWVFTLPAHPGAKVFNFGEAPDLAERGECLRDSIRDRIVCELAGGTEVLHRAKARARG